MAGQEHNGTCQKCGNGFVMNKGGGRPRLFCLACRPRKSNTVEAMPATDVKLVVSTGAGIRCCPLCSKVFYAIHSAQRLCSPECKTVRVKQHARNTQERRRDKGGERTCANPRCDVAFAPAYGDTRVRYCSTQCRLQHKWQLTPDSCHRRRARRFGSEYEAVDPIKVFARDGWRCQLCGKKLKATDRGTTRPEAPELDHVVPLSKGGAHAWANVQCACRACNGAKGATACGQLGLPLAA